MGPSARAGGPVVAPIAQPQQGVGLGATPAQNRSGQPNKQQQQQQQQQQHHKSGVSARSVLVGAALNNYTVTALGRWSVSNSSSLPAPDSIKELHVYDFDNTLFKTPLPNQALWTPPTFGFLCKQDAFASGGWWHDARILACTGEGLAKEEPRAWDGWWNEKIVELVRLSMEQEDALTVLLTGRSESGFSDLVRRIVSSKGLVFDMLVLKPAVGPNNERCGETMAFKQTFLRSLMGTYRDAREIRIYEDRVKHAEGFRNFLDAYNDEQRRAGPRAIREPLFFEVIQVAELNRTLDCVTELAEVQHMVNAHNKSLAKLPVAGATERLAIKRTVFFTAYMIDKTDSKRLLSLVPGFSDGSDGDLDMKHYANNIVICPRPASASILSKVGGKGSRVRWEVTSIGSLENRIWAARVAPVPRNTPFHTENSAPLVVLAGKKASRPFEATRIHNWHPVPREKAYVFETTVGEKEQFRIEPEDPNEDAFQSLFPNNKSSKRKHTGDDEPSFKPPTGPAKGNHGGGGGGGGRGGNAGGGRGGGSRNHNNAAGHHGGRSGRGGGGRAGGGGGGGGGGGQGRGNRGGKKGGHYHSLDDPGTKNSNPGPSQAVIYEDVPTGPSAAKRAGGSGPNQNQHGGGGGNSQSNLNYS